MSIDAWKAEVYAAEDAIAPLAEEISKQIYLHPELGEAEHWSSKYLTEQAAKLGFTVQMPYCGLDTAFRCEFGDDDGPRVAFLAEYDALPGYENTPDGSGNAHACGHNWIAASTFAACAALKAAKPHFHGKIVWIGTPAEETTGGKVDMVQAGAFEDIDAVFQFHLGPYNCVESVALAVCDYLFIFKGKASHASSEPEEGINALDACNLTFAGVNALRQHLTSDVRIHGIIREGGTACNTVPDHCVMHYFIRAAKRDALETVVEKVLNCARGAALMTGCELEMIRSRNTFDDIKPNIPLRQAMQANLEALGEGDFVPDDLYHSGSTDIGNVSYAAPTFYGYMGTLKDCGPATAHTAAFLDVVESPAAHRMLHTAAKAMAATALDVLCDESLQQAIAH